MKLIKKHSGGGWINKGKAIWDYSDGPEDIRKKIARYYINFTDANNGDTEKVKAYLSKHTDLAAYLDRVYAKGIDWNGQKALGNNSNAKYLNYQNSEGETGFTTKGGDRDQWARTKGYDNYNDFLATLEKAGYTHSTAGTQFSLENDNGTKTTYYAAEDPKDGIMFINGNHKAGVTKDALTRRINALENRAKKAALSSSASAKWLKTSSRLGTLGRFYNLMRKAGFSYNSNKGTYSKGNTTLSVDSYGQVFNNSKALNDADLRQLLHINQ